MLGRDASLVSQFFTKGKGVPGGTPVAGAAIVVNEGAVKHGCWTSGAVSRDGGQSPASGPRLYCRASRAVRR